MNTKDNYPECHIQIREALVREIRDAQRWSSMVEAWEALLQVRRLAEELKEEEEVVNSSMGRSEFEKALGIK